MLARMMDAVQGYSRVPRKWPQSEIFSFEGLGGIDLPLTRQVTAVNATVSIIWAELWQQVRHEVVSPSA